MNWLYVFLTLATVYALIGLAHFLAWLESKGWPHWLLTLLSALPAALFIGYIASQRVTP